MSEFTSWKDPDLPAPVRFAPEALDRIRRSAIDGLLSLPRVGVGVGGLLLGARDSAGILVSDFREIPCGHAFGPSFRLTEEELAAASVETQSTADGLNVVGCWISKTRGGSQLAPGDRIFFDSLCPETWQIGFVVAPSSVRPTSGAIFARTKTGVLKGGALLDIAPLKTELPPPEEQPNEVQPVEAKPAVEKPPVEAEPIPPPVVPAAPQPPPQPKLEPKLEALPPRPVLADGPPFTTPPERPLFAVSAPPPEKNAQISFKWILAAILVAVLSVAAFATRNYWIPGRSLDLRSSESNGRLIIEWNRKAVRGIPRALLTVKDGPDTRTLTVEGSILHSGSLDYERKSGKVTIRMRAGSADETTTFNSNP